MLRAILLVSAFVLYLVIGVHGLLDCPVGKPLKCFSNIKFRKYYDEIDEILKKTKSEDPNTLMRAIRNLMKIESSLGLNRDKEYHLKALNQLLDLAHDGPGRCSPSTGRTLKKIDLSLRGAIVNLAPDEIPKRKIERFVNHYAEAFITECDYEKLLSGFEKESFEYIENIVGEYIGSRAAEDTMHSIFRPKIPDPSKFVQKQPEVAKTFAKSLIEKSVRKQKDAAIVSKWIEIFIMKKLNPQPKYLRNVFSTGKVIVDRNDAESLFKEYVTIPCNEFTELVGITFGNKWALAKSIKRRMNLAEKAKLYKNLAYYYGCLSLKHNQYEIIRELERINRRT